MNFDYSQNDYDYNVFGNLQRTTNFVDSDKENSEVLHPKKYLAGQNRDRFIPSRESIIYVDKPKTLYEEVLYKALFNGQDVKNSYLPIHQPTYSNTLAKYDKWIVLEKPLFSLSLDDFNYNESINPIAWIKANQFVLSYHGGCHLFTGKQQQELPFLSHPYLSDAPTINAVHFDPEESNIALSYQHKPYCVFDFEREKMIYKSRFESSGRIISKIHLSNRSCSYICGSKFYIQDLREKGITKNAYSLGDEKKTITCFDYTQSQNSVALGTHLGNVYVYDKVAKKIRFSGKVDSGLNDIKWEPSSCSKLATATESGVISIYDNIDSDSSKIPRTIKSDSPILSMMWTEKKCLVSGHDNIEGTIKVWDVNSLDLKAQFGVEGAVYNMVPSLDKSHFAVVGQNLSLLESPHIQNQKPSAKPILKRKPSCSILYDYPTIR